jgi:ribosomal protein S4
MRHRSSRFFYSNFLVNFETKQYLRERYGLYRIKQLLSLFQRNKKYTPSSVLNRLEMRLGTVLVSIGFVPTSLAARQLSVMVSF